MDPQSSSSFTVDVPAPDNDHHDDDDGGLPRGTTTTTTTTSLRPETFEWRPSRGPAIAALAAGRGLSSRGIKLVRLATDAGRGGGEIASGGGEVVAVYVGRRPAAAVFRGLGGNRGYFMFQGTGAQGILGETFRVVAVMTAVGVWDRQRRETRGG